jgi:hypothetical protein
MGINDRVNLGRKSMGVLGSILAAGVTEAVCAEEVACRAGSGAIKGCWFVSLEGEARLLGAVDLLAGVRGAGQKRKRSTTWRKNSSGGSVTNGYLTYGLAVSSLLGKEDWGRNMRGMLVAVLVEVHQLVRQST